MDGLTQTLEIAGQAEPRACPPALVGATAHGQAATPSPSGARTARPGEYLTCRLGGEEYAIDILQVQEIRSYETPIRIAGAPPHVRGVINLRGVIVPIVDLRLRLGCESAECTASTAVVVLNVGQRVVGAVVDAVADVVAIGAGAMRPAPLPGTDHSHGITGLATLATGDEQRMLILLDIERSLAGADVGPAESEYPVA